LSPDITSGVKTSSVDVNRKISLVESSITKRGFMGLNIFQESSLNPQGSLDDKTKLVCSEYLRH